VTKALSRVPTGRRKSLNFFFHFSGLEEAWKQVRSL